MPRASKSHRQRLLRGCESVAVKHSFAALLASSSYALMKALHSARLDLYRY